MRWVEAFERQIAEILGKEAAVLMPSGTMAQQIALRIHCDQRGVSTVAFHPTCHLELFEHAGYAHLHGLKAELVGDRGIATHLDGARIWESAPYYGRAYAEIAALFDSVYVSLYKGLVGVASSVLAGRSELVEEARVWRHRHGGALTNLFPFAAAALHGFNVLVAQMPRFLDHARALALALREVPGVSIVPDPPQTPLFHLHLRGDRDVLWERMLDLAQARGVWLANRVEPSVVPNVAKLELNIGEPDLEITAGEAAELFAAIVAA